MTPFYEKRKSSGLCVTCGVKLPEGAACVNCDACRIRINTLSVKLYEERKSARICIDCGVKLLPQNNFVRCFSCRRKVAESSRRSQARRRQKEEGQK